MKAEITTVHHYDGSIVEKHDHSRSLQHRAGKWWSPGMIRAQQHEPSVSGSMVGSVYRIVVYSTKNISSHVRGTFRYHCVSANGRLTLRGWLDHGWIIEVSIRLPSFLGALVYWVPASDLSNT